MSIVLVTGCAGFIGAKVAELLLRDGKMVVGVDNLNDYYDVALKRHRLAKLSKFPKFEFWPVDVENNDALENLFRGTEFNVVMHLAARAGVRASIAEPSVYLSTNALGTLNLLELSVAYNVSSFVLASTSSLYAGTAMPFVEDANVSKPISPYAATKLAAEALASTWNHLHDINVAVLRYFTVYGPAGRPDMSPFRFAESIRRGVPLVVYGDGEQTRDFTYVDDIAAGTVAAAGVQGYEVVNLGGGHTPTSINEMIAMLEDMLGKKAVVEYQGRSNADMTDTAADVRKANALMGWRPTVAPQDGLKKLAEWHLDNGEWLDAIAL